jgi:xanthine dehydrogenase YagR molybdenum-binding subunit
MDPLAFRLANYAEVEPISGKPFSSKSLRECYAQGAERFGWARRPLAPRQMRDEAGLLVRAGVAEIEGHGQSATDPAAQSSYSMYAHGAVYAEVKVDPELGRIRVTRLVGAFAAGQVINPRLVRSRYFGGMIWGVSFALHEHAVIDRRSRRVMNPNLGEYHVPVNADVPSLDAILVEENDPHVNALGIKGVGEIGITGTAGAIANAVWHATGIRVRRFPITLDRLIEFTP